MDESSTGAMTVEIAMITPPDPAVRAEALERLDGLAKPLGALGRLEQVGAWLAACQGSCPPVPIDRVRAVVLAGDHGVTASGVSAYPSDVTAAMVQAFSAGVAGVSVLARQHGATVRVLDIAVDADLSPEASGLPADVTAHKLTRSSGSIDVTDAIGRDLAERAIMTGGDIADAEIDAGAQLLVLGDMGIGNTTPSAALIAASLGLRAVEVIGRGTGIDDETHARKLEVLASALARTCDDDGRIDDPVRRLAALGSADLAVGAGFLVQAARRGVPVLLDGVIACAEALLAEDLAPGAAAWFLAGHRSPEPAQARALAALGLEPLLELGMRLGEGSGAMAAVPLVRSAALLIREMALLADLVGP